MSAARVQALVWLVVVIIVIPWASPAEASPPAQQRASSDVDTATRRVDRVRQSYTGDLGAEVVAAARTPEGDLVIALEPAHVKWGCCNANVGAWALARLSPSGAPRTGFGTDGVVQPALSAEPGSMASFRPSDMVVDGAGRILMLGTRQTEGGEGPLTIVRRTSTGAPDNSFGKNGTVTLPRPARCVDTPSAHDLLRPSTGGTLVFGSCYARGRFALAVWRLRDSGATNTSFGTAGSVVIPLPAAVGACCAPRGIEAPDGKFVVGMSSNVAAVLRLRADGSPDRSFSGDGIATVPTAGFDSQGSDSVVVDADGGVLSTMLQGWIMRFRADGSRDTAFGNRTFAQTTPCSYPRPVDVIVVQAGTIGALQCSEGLTLSRLDPSGSIDPAFTPRSSTVRSTSGDDFLGPMRMLLRDRTGFLVVGSSATGWGATVERRLADGRLDTDYGRAGRTHVDITGRFFSLDSADGALDPEGRTVTATRVTNRRLGDEGAIAVSRFLPGGTPDRTFGRRGTLVIETGGFRAGGDESTDDVHVAVHPDASITIVAGWTNDDGILSEFAEGVFHGRVSVRGSLIPGSRRIVELPAQIGTEISPPIALSDGAVLVGFAQESGGDSRPAVVRLLQSGAVDLTFGENGSTAIRAKAAYGSERIDLARSTNGAVYVAWRNYSSNWDRDAFVVTRILADGRVDGAFGTNGFFRRNLPSGVFIAATEEGRLAVGWSEFDSSSFSTSGRVLRLTPGGRPDTSFSGDGTADMPRTGNVVGMTTSGERPVLLTETDDATRELRRFTSGGRSDASFGRDGRLVIESGIVQVGGLRNELIGRRNGMVSVVGVPFTDQSETPDTLRIITVGGD